MPLNQFYLEVSRRVDEEWWNSLVQSVPEGTIFQTTYWADFSREWANLEPIYLTVRDRQNRAVGLLLCFKGAYLSDTLSRRPFASVTTSLLRTILPMYTWLAGPLVLEKESWQEIFAPILSWLKHAACGNAIKGTLPLVFSEPFQEEAEKYFIENGFDATLWATFLVDLTLDEDVLWNSLSKTRRWEIRSCPKRGVAVDRIGSEEELERYYELLLEARKRLGLDLPPYFPNTTMWKHLREKGAVEVFVAKQNNRWLAALGVLCFNNILLEIAAAQSDYAVRNKLYASELIQWEIIKWGHENGYKTYDLAGASPNPTTTKEKGIYVFKAKWGGELVNYCTYNKQFSVAKKLLAYATSLSVNLLEGMRRIGRR